MVSREYVYAYFSAEGMAMPAKWVNSFEANINTLAGGGVAGKPDNIR